jgi:hypothetical protein
MHTRALIVLSAVIAAAPAFAGPRLPLHGEGRLSFPADSPTVGAYPVFEIRSRTVLNSRPEEGGSGLASCDIPAGTKLEYLPSAEAQVNPDYVGIRVMGPDSVLEDDNCREVLTSFKTQYLPKRALSLTPDSVVSEEPAAPESDAYPFRCYDSGMAQRWVTNLQTMAVDTLKHGRRHCATIQTAWKHPFKGDCWACVSQTLDRAKSVKGGIISRIGGGLNPWKYPFDFARLFARNPAAWRAFTGLQKVDHITRDLDQLPEGSLVVWPPGVPGCSFSRRAGHSEVVTVLHGERYVCSDGCITVRERKAACKATPAGIFIPARKNC